MKNIPHCSQYLASDGDLHLHFVLVAYCALDIAEAIVIAAMCLTGRPRAFYERFPQIFVAVGDFPGLDLAGTLFITWFEPGP